MKSKAAHVIDELLNINCGRNAYYSTDFDTLKSHWLLASNDLQDKRR